jgi:hypothetical protein
MDVMWAVIVTAFVVAVVLWLVWVFLVEPIRYPHRH